MEQVVSEAEKDKTKALEDQRELFRRIGGYDFRRALDVYELQEAKNAREIALLEAHHMFARSQDAGKGNTHHRSKSVHYISNIPNTVGSRHPCGFPQAMRNVPGAGYHNDAPQQFMNPDIPTRGRSSTVQGGPQPNPHVSFDPQMPGPTSTRNRSSTLDPSSVHSFPPGYYVPTGVTRSHVGPPSYGPLPPVAAKFREEGRRFYSPFFCQDCGEKFSVEGVGHYEDHRFRCKGKSQRVGVETGDLKAVKLGRSKTVATGSAPFYGLKSVPNLHAPLAQVGIQIAGSHVSPPGFTSFRFPAQSPPTKETQTVPTSGVFTPSPVKSEAEGSDHASSVDTDTFITAVTN